MTTAASAALAADVRMIRAAADLIEQAASPGLAVYPGPHEIVIQVPQGSGGLAARAASVARLAALTGCEAGTDQRPGSTHGWLSARGRFAGYPVRVFAPVEKEEAS